MSNILNIDDVIVNNSLSVDGYEISCDDGALVNQVLQYNGSAFVPTGNYVVLYHNFADYGNNLKPGNQTGNYTNGIKIQCYVPFTLYGVKFYWNGGHGNLTYRCKVWTTGGSEVVSTDVAVNAEGTYSGFFSTPWALLANTYYWITIWETTGTYNQFPCTTSPAPTIPVYMGGSMYIDTAWYAAGDAVPDSNEGSPYPISPIYTI